MLPLTITVREFAGREKIAYLPRRLRYRGSRGSDPKNGDLIYYVPWGNLGVYSPPASATRTTQSISAPTTLCSINSSDSKAE